MYFELLASIIIVVALAVITRLIIGTKYDKAIIFLAFAFLVVIVYFTTIRGARQGLGGVSIKFPLPFLKAIMTGRYRLTTNRSMLNILLFVPFGFLMPAVFYLIIPQNALSKLKTGSFVKCIYIVLLGFLVSLTVELCQLIFKTGVFEIDDLLKNTIGAFLGYIVFKKFIAGKIISDKSFS